MMLGQVRWKARYSILSIIVVATLVSSIDKIAMSVAIPYIAADLHLSPVAMGAVMSAFFLSYSLAQIPGGMLADRFGVRRIAVVAMIWWSAFTALTGMTNSLGQLASTRFVFGIGEGVFPACAFKAVALWFPKRERATANSIMFAAGFLGAAMAPLLVVAIIGLWGWREVFFALFIPGIAIAILFWRFVPDQPADHPSISAQEIAEMRDGQDTAEPSRVPMRQILGNPTVIRYFLIIFSFDLTYAGFTAWLPTYLVKARGFSMMEMGITASLPAFAGTIGCALAGWMSDRFFNRNRKLPIIVAELMAALCLYLMFSATSTAPLIAFQTLAGFFIMFFFGVFWALPMNSVPARHMGVTGAFINMAGQFAAVTAPLVIGYLVDISAGHFSLAFAFLIASLLVSCGIVMTIPPQSGSNRRPVALG